MPYHCSVEREQPPTRHEERGSQDTKGFFDIAPPTHERDAPRTKCVRRETRKATANRTANDGTADVERESHYGLSKYRALFTGNPSGVLVGK